MFSILGSLLIRNPPPSPIFFRLFFFSPSSFSSFKLLLLPSFLSTPLFFLLMLSLFFVEISIKHRKTAREGSHSVRHGECLSGAHPECLRGLRDVQHQHTTVSKHHVRGLRRHWSGSGDRADGGRSDGGRSGGSAGASATDGGVPRWYGGVLQAVPRGVRRAKPRRFVGAQDRVRHAPHLRDHRALGEMRGAWGDGERARKKDGSHERKYTSERRS